MGTMVELNDTLRINSEQGFPPELNYEKHKEHPLTAEQFSNKVFAFASKPKIRMYHSAPVRNFLVEERDGKWIYWGHVHILETVHDHANNSTSGKFKIVYIFTPEEMAIAHDLIDRRPEVRFDY